MEGQGWPASWILTRKEGSRWGGDFCREVVEAQGASFLGADVVLGAAELVHLQVRDRRPREDQVLLRSHSQ